MNQFAEAMDKYDCENACEHCWRTGVYSDDCECEFCSHKHECSGYKDDIDE